MGERSVGLTSSEYISKVCDLLPSNEGRQSLIYWLISTLGVDSKCDHIIPIHRASGVDIKKFHDSKFVDFILQKRDRFDNESPNAAELRDGRSINVFASKKMKSMSASELTESSESEGGSNSDSDEEDDDYPKATFRNSHESQDEPSRDELESFGLLDDCHVFPFMRDYIQLVAGSTISTANFIIQSHRDSGGQIVGINWYGGRHHCLKNMAAGFCYVNDIVLGINALRTKFNKVFYLDLDLHHGDGVEKAFKFSSKVVTCSVHRHDIGFYPGSGTETVTGKLINIPTRKGLSNDSLKYILQNIVSPCITEANPSVIVLQAGCDGLALDPNKEWNLTIEGFTDNIEWLLSTFECPFMILGGGGYNNTETAKFCTYLTSRLASPQPADGDTDCFSEIPEHPYLDSYEADGYSFWTPENVTPKRIQDGNDEEYLHSIKEKVLEVFCNK